jgi:adenylate cyclase
MNWALLNIIRPKVQAKYPNLAEGEYEIEHTAGIDAGEVLVVRAGVRNSNDLISIGTAPNVAAALSDRRNAPYRSYITKAVYDSMLEKAKVYNGQNMWEARTYKVKDKTIDIYRSSWRWVID